MLLNVDRKRLAVIGLGAMGKLHLRVARQNPDLFEAVAGYDDDERVRAEVCARFGVLPAGSLDEAIDRAEVVVVATPTVAHLDVAARVIAAGRHVFVEKPLADTVERARRLVAAAAAARVRLVVGHTERFNPVVAWLRARLREEEILSINIERVGPRPPRIKDVGVVTDLGVHDVDLLAVLSGSRIRHVACVARATLGGKEDVAEIIAQTESGVVGSITTNWLTPFKSRRIQVATSRQYFSADLLRNLGKVYVALDESATTHSVEEVIIPWREPLQQQAEALAQLLAGDDSSPSVRGEDGLEALVWIEACLADANRSARS